EWIAGVRSAAARRAPSRARRVAERPRAAAAAARMTGRGGARISQTRALRVLKEVAEALNKATSEQQVASESLARLSDLLGVETGWVWLRDPDVDRFYSAAARRLPPWLREPVRMTGHPCHCLRLFREGRL